MVRSATFGLAVLALALAPMQAALAQSAPAAAPAAQQPAPAPPPEPETLQPGGHPAAPQTPPAPDIALPPPPPLAADPPPLAPGDLDARLHHEATQAQVNEREDQRFGAAAVQARDQQEQQEIDKLYFQLLGKPANPTGQ
jgi:hypothetical protein